MSLKFLAAKFFFGRHLQCAIILDLSQRHYIPSTFVLNLRFSFIKRIISSFCTRSFYRANGDYFPAGLKPRFGVLVSVTMYMGNVMECDITMSVGLHMLTMDSCCAEGATLDGNVTICQPASIEDGHIFSLLASHLENVDFDGEKSQVRIAPQTVSPFYQICTWQRPARNGFRCRASETWAYNRGSKRGSKKWAHARIKCEGIER